MSKKRPRVFGTSETAIHKAEQTLGFIFPPSFRAWLFKNNGLNPINVSIFPVFDERDPRSTFDSIVRQFQVNWLGWQENFDDTDLVFDHLLPFSNVGNGDYYCFDYSRQQLDGERPVVIWSHETGECKDRAETFLDFLSKAQRGEFEFD